MLESRLRTILSQSPEYCVFSLPGSDRFHCWQLKEEKQKTGEFLFYPFDDQESRALRFKTTFKLECGIEEMRELLKGEERPHPVSGLAPLERQNQAEYVRLVQKALDHIESGALEKVVCSRMIRFKADAPLSVPHILLELKSRHPNAFVYLFKHPEAGTWIGASPELLIEKQGQNAHTVALAGTLPWNSSSDWSEKEIREQDLVTAYIRSKLQGAALNSPEVEGPYEVSAGKLRHLRSDIRFQSEEFIGTLAKLLHPTPAIAGVPGDIALNFLRENEGYRRSYYTGYLGPLGLNGKDHLFVNLRCAQLLNDEWRVYAGAGIVKGSDPQREWEETERKASTILSGLENLQNFEPDDLR